MFVGNHKSYEHNGDKGKIIHSWWAYKTYFYNLKTQQSRFNLFLTIVKMDTAHSSETLVTIYLSTWFHYQDYLTIHHNCCEKVKSCKTNRYF